MGQYLSNGELILDARDDLHRSAAVLTHGHVLLRRRNNTSIKKTRFNRCAHVMAT
jgi:hypothetical protein